MVYLHQGRIADAKGEFTELLRTDKNDAYAHFGLGMALAAEENHQGAVQEFKTAAQIQPDFSSAFYKIGLEETKLKQYDEAIADFRKQVENWGDDYATETALADAYQAKGMLGRSKSCARKSREVEARQITSSPTAILEKPKAATRLHPENLPVPSWFSFPPFSVPLCLCGG